ncbi:MAG TPA: UDP-glucose/GDP-mannose dehydrogenase family protein, partial [Gammaproteobacteria bacterium]
SIYEMFDGADAVVLMTEWNQYRGLDLDKVKSKMKGNIFIDLCNVYERDLMKNHGFDYFCVGRNA